MLDKKTVFRFKQFDIIQLVNIMKVNTDGILLGAWSQIEGKKNILDIGTGTGLIALMLAQRTIGATVTGIEIDLPSAEEAALNMSNSRFGGRLNCIHTSIQDFARDDTSKFDLIVSNPPFFSGGTFSTNENKANVRHTQKLSHIDLLNSVRTLLSPDGHFDLILPYIEGLRFLEMGEKYDFKCAHITEIRSKDRRPVERLLIRLGQSPVKKVKNDTLIMMNHGEGYDYSSSFIKLTKDFYLSF
ncbi:MAG: methyltransferase [Saprospiraceae bacterium]